MVDAGGPLLTSLGVWLGTYLLHSTVLVAGVALATRLRGASRPVTRDFLWKVALLGALATSGGVTFRSSTRGIGSDTREVEARLRRSVAGGPTTWAREDGERAEIRQRASATPPTPACRRALASLTGDPGADLTALRSGCLADEGRGASPILALLVLGWLAGGVLWLVLALRRWWALKAMLTEVASAGDRVLAAMKGVDGPSALPGAVVISDVVGSPCAFGNRIILPSRCETELSDSELDAVLAHEAAHVSRRDSVWTGLADVVVALFWIQPLNRLVRSRMLDAAELVCDDWAVVRTRRPRDLARSISRVAEWSRRPALPVPVPGLARRGSGRISNRVRRILSEPVQRNGGGRGRRWLTAGLLVLPLALLPGWSPGAAHAVVVTREAVSVGPGAPEADTDSVRIEVRAFEIR